MQAPPPALKKRMCDIVATFSRLIDPNFRQQCLELLRLLLSTFYPFHPISHQFYPSCLLDPGHPTTTNRPFVADLKNLDQLPSLALFRVAAHPPGTHGRLFPVATAVTVIAAAGA